MSVLHNGGAVDVGGHLPAEGLIEQVVLGGAGKVLRAADKVVVNDVGEVVGGHTVCLDKYLILQLAVLHLDMTVDYIVERGHALGRHFLPDDIRLTCLELCLYLLTGKAAALSVIVADGLTRSLLLLVEGIEALLSAEAVIGIALLYQLFCILLEHTHSLALDIRAVVSADIGALVPVHAVLLEGLVDNIHRALNISLLVGVLDAQDKAALIVLGGQVGIERSSQVADVHIARG